MFAVSFQFLIHKQVWNVNLDARLPVRCMFHTRINIAPVNALGDPEPSKIK